MKSNPQFPIGTFNNPTEITAAQIQLWIADIAELPSEIEAITKDLTETELQFQYRENGWNIAQIVHHLVDSHLNSYIRFKLAISENKPTIKPYEEAIWAEFSDAKSLDISTSLQLLKALHKRWTIFLSSLSSTDLQRTFIHPEHGKEFSLEENIGIYAWHGKHHLAHIHLALEWNKK